MAVAGHIVANLTANTSGWSSGLKGAISPLNAFAAGVSALATVAVSRFASVGDELEKMSVRTGVSATELKHLRFAANLADTSLESLQAGLTKQAVFMRAASAGQQEAIATLDALGLSVSQLAGLSPEQKFSAFADALNSIPDPGLRSALAMKVFGKGAVDLLPLLSSGSAGLAEYAAEAERLGLVMDNEAAAKSAKLADSLTTLGMVADNLLVTVGSELAPVVTYLATELAGWLANNRELITTIGKTAAVIAIVVGAYKAWTLATQAAAAAQRIMLAFSGPTGLAMLAAGVFAIGAATWAVDSAFDAANEKLAQATSLSQQSSAAIRDETAQMHGRTAAIQDYSQIINGLRSAYDSTLPKVDQLKQRLAAMDRDWDAAKKAGETTLITWTQLEGLKTRTLLGESGWTAEFEGLSNQLAVLRGDITETEQQFAQMAAFGVDTRHIDALRQMMAERDRLLSEQQQKEREAEAKQSSLSATQSRVRDANQTPLQKFAEEVEAVEEAMKAGLLTRAESVKYLEDQRRKLLESAAADDTPTPELRKQASNNGIDARSAHANQMVVDLANRRGGGTKPEDKALAEAKKQTQLEEESRKLLVDIRNDNRRRAIVTTKPLQGRSS